MTDEEARKLRAYQLWESEGRPEGRDLAHWYQADDGETGVADQDARYVPYDPGAAAAGSLVIKFYHSGDQIRGYVRKIAETGEDDTIFPGEEMEPEAAFKLAESHNGDSGKPIFVELVEGVEWDPSWGALGRGDLETSPVETDDSRSADNPTTGRRRSRVARGTGKGLDRAMGKTQPSQGTIETASPTVQEPKRGKK
ncbi:DUF2934 domain-containing protein [Rhizobium sp. P40RR-XXII]|uniref:DUF2934 domain-containing protein n=1 Tax=Rhizobium sp. P40RR-XXII TaxID=2726739 RepID=UPI00145746E9|nr:DUF2934 domain-containing protein [Rhizobium sp. P40RR-XXII]NLS18545.1 DUF2934 domain-containing protein [Rhizobium sp. P40RR-XXII]